MNWFRDRLKNQKPWFRIDSGIQSLEGQKLSNSELRISTKFERDWICITISKDNALKLADWIRKAYPTGVLADVIKLPTRPLPVSETPRDPSPSPDPFGG